MVKIIENILSSNLDLDEFFPRSPFEIEQKRKIKYTLYI